MRGMPWGKPLKSLVINRNRTGHNFDFIYADLFRKEHNILRNIYVE